MVMNKRRTLAVLSGLLASAGAVQHLDNLPETYCITYLSTYLATVSSNTTSSIPTDVGERSSESAGTLSTELIQSDSAPEPTTNVFTYSQSTRSRTEPSTTTGPTDPGLAGRSVVFRIVPDIQDSKRSLRKRALGGLVGSPQDDCNEASTFRLSKGRLLDGIALVFYGGEDFKELRVQAGSRPIGAVTTTFTEDGGFLRFRNNALPNGEAGFCQTPNDGRVYLTFTSSPLGCVTIRLSVIETEQCEDTASSSAGASDSTEPSGDLTATTLALTSVHDVTSNVDFPTLRPTSGEAAVPNPVRTSSHWFSNTSSSIASSIAPTESSEESPSTVKLSSTNILSTDALPPQFSSSVTFPVSLDITTTGEILSTDSLSTESLDETDGTSSGLMETAVSTSLEIEASTVSTSDTSSTMESQAVRTTVTESVTAGTVESTSVVLSQTTTAETTTTTGPPTRACEFYFGRSQTTLFAGDQAWDSEVKSIDLPWPVGIYTESSDKIYIGVNGLISLFDDSISISKNAELPSDTIPPVAIAPYWDDLRIKADSGHEITYDLYESDNFRAVSIEWCGVDSDDVLTHFVARFEEYTLSNPAAVFMRYFTTNGGQGATIGIQDRNKGKSLQYSFNGDTALPDGCTVLFFTLGGDERIAYVGP